MPENNKPKVNVMFYKDHIEALEEVNRRLRDSIDDCNIEEIYERISILDSWLYPLSGGSHYPVTMSLKFSQPGLRERLNRVIEEINTEHKNNIKRCECKNILTKKIKV